MAEQAGLTVVTWNAQGSRGLDIARRGRRPGGARTRPRAAPGGPATPARRVAGRARRASTRAVAVQALAGTEARRGSRAARAASRHRRPRSRCWPTAGSSGTGAGASRSTPRCVAGDHTVRLVDVHLGAGVSHDERVAAGARAARPGRRRRADRRRPQRRAGVGRARAAPRRGMERCRGTACAGAGVHRPSTNWPPGPRTAAPTQRLDYLLVRDATSGAPRRSCPTTGRAGPSSAITCRWSRASALGSVGRAAPGTGRGSSAALRATRGCRRARDASRASPAGPCTRPGSSAGRAPSAS